MKRIAITLGWAGLGLMVLVGCATQEARAVRSVDLWAIEVYIRSGGDVGAPSVEASPS